MIYAVFYFLLFRFGVGGGNFDVCYVCVYDNWSNVYCHIFGVLYSQIVSLK